MSVWLVVHIASIVKIVRTDNPKYLKILEFFLLKLVIFLLPQSMHSKSYMVSYSYFSLTYRSMTCP